MASEGFENCAVTVANRRGVRLVAAVGIVKYGVPEMIPVTFTSVTSDVSQEKSICNRRENRSVPDIPYGHGPVESLTYPAIGLAGCQRCNLDSKARSDHLWPTLISEE